VLESRLIHKTTDCGVEALLFCFLAQNLILLLTRCHAELQMPLNAQSIRSSRSEFLAFHSLITAPEFVNGEIARVSYSILYLKQHLRNYPMKRSINVSLATMALSLCMPVLVHAESNASNPVDETRNVIKEWVNTRALIAQKQNSWKVEKELINHRVGLLQSEIQKLQEEIAADDLDKDRAAERREELSRQKEDLRNASKVVEYNLEKYEARIREIAAYLPDPLKKKTDVLIGIMPKQGVKTAATVANRMATIVAILNEIDKFNKVVTLASETRAVEGSNIQVDVVYFGLAMAIYSDASGSKTGVGTPSSKGWEWVERPDAAVEINKGINVAKGVVKPAEFVNLPLSVQDVK
jgi:hypothetical protein